MHIKIKTPAKINLSLDVIGQRADGYHDILSIMQTISLYDYLTFELTKSKELEIELSGNNSEIPYDSKNLIYKAITLFYKEFPYLPVCKIKIYIEKNIPIQAGLGGGSSNAAGVIWALNKLFNLNLPKEKQNSLCGLLGSDLNVCYWGGTCIAASRGEIVDAAPFRKYPVSIIKPRNFGISAKSGYQMYDELGLKKMVYNTKRLINGLENHENISTLLYNDLEIAPLKKYKKLEAIKIAYPDSLMTGSGSAFFVLKSNIPKLLPESEYLYITGMKFINCGIEEV